MPISSSSSLLEMTSTKEFFFRKVYATYGTLFFVYAVEWQANRTSHCRDCEKKADTFKHSNNKLQYLKFSPMIGGQKLKKLKK